MPSTSEPRSADLGFHMMGRLTRLVAAGQMTIGSVGVGARHVAKLVERVRGDIDPKAPPSVRAGTDESVDVGPAVAHLFDRRRPLGRCGAGELASQALVERPSPHVAGNDVQ